MAKKHRRARQEAARAAITGFDEIRIGASPAVRARAAEIGKRRTAHNGAIAARMQSELERATHEAIASSSLIVRPVSKVAPTRLKIKPGTKIKVSTLAKLLEEQPKTDGGIKPPRNFNVYNKYHGRAKGDGYVVLVDADKLQGNQHSRLSGTGDPR